jgi:hypothetical protein
MPPGPDGPLEARSKCRTVSERGTSVAALWISVGPKLASDGPGWEAGLGGEAVARQSWEQAVEMPCFRESFQLPGPTILELATGSEQRVLRRRGDEDFASLCAR